MNEVGLGSMTGSWKAMGWCVAILSAFLLYFAPSSAASLGVDTYWGSVQGQNAQQTGGRFSDRAPAGIGVYEQTGDVYVADTQFNRVQQFDEDGGFIRAWGFDVTSPPASPSSSASFEICSDKGQCKAGVASGVEPVNGLGGQLSSPTGIAVDQGSGHVYVANAGLFRIEEYTAAGGFVRAFGLDVVSSGPDQADEEQRLTVNAGAGQYKLKFDSAETADIDWNESPSGVEAKLNALGPINTGGGSVIVSGGPGAVGGASPYLVRFAGARADTDQPDIEVTPGSVALSGGSGTGADTAAIAAVNDGAVGYEVCNAASSCQAGTSGVTAGALAASDIGTGNTVGPSLSIVRGGGSAPNAGNLLMADPLNRRVQEFSPTGAFVRAFGWDVVASGPDSKNFASGADRADEVQTVIVRATSGSFKLQFGSGGAGVSETAELPYQASALQVQDALNAITNISGSGGSVAVSGGPGDVDGSTPYVVTFGGSLAGVDTEEIVGIDISLIGGVNAPALPPVLAFTRSEGARGFEVCRAQTGDICAAGSAGAGDGQFDGGAVTSVAQDSSGTIYTVESYGSSIPFANELGIRSAGFRVQRFTQSGTDLNPQGEWMCAMLCGRDNLLRRDAPQAVATDAQGAVYVAKGFLKGTGEPPVVIPTVGADARHWQDRVLKIDPSGNGGAGLIEETINANTGQEPGPEGDGGQRVIEDITALAPVADGKPLYMGTGEKPNGTFARSRVYRLNEIVPPSASVSTVSVGSTSASLAATVEPAETFGPVKTLYRFEYRRQGVAEWSRTPDQDVDIGNGSAGGESSSCSSLQEAATCHLSGVIDNLDIGRTYQYRLVAHTSYQGSVVATAPQEFETTATPPTATTGSAVWSGPPSSQPSLAFNGSVNPQGAKTSFAFEYVTQAQFEAAGFAAARTAPTSPVDAGHGARTIEVTAVASGLDPSSAYKFRLVATNAAGATVAGDELVGPSRAGDRFVELVSDGDSQGGDVQPSFTVSDDGERVAFKAIAFGDQHASPWIQTPAIARRGGGGWTAAAVTNDPAEGAGSLGPLGGVGDAAVSQRLWQASPTPQSKQWLVRGLDGALNPISPEISPLDRVGDFKLDYQAASPDFSTLLFSGGGSTLFPDEPLLQGGASNLYVVEGAGSDNPTVSLVNRGAGGAVIGGTCGSVVGASGVVRRYRAVSTDGSIVYFSTRPDAPANGSCTSTSSGSGQVTAGSTSISVSSGSFAVGQSISATNVFTGANLLPAGTAITAVGSPPGTITISAPASKNGIGNLTASSSPPARIIKRVGGGPATELPACGKTPPAICSSVGDDIYVGASGDGARVFFSTSRALADSDVDSTNDLYLYDSSPPSGQPNVVQVSAGELVPGDNPGDPAAHEIGKGAEVVGVADVSMDGSRVYFAAKGRLTAAAAQGANNLYVFERDAAHPTGRIHLVAILAPGAPVAGARTDARVWNLGTDTTAGLRPALAVPRDERDGDGHIFVFVSSQALLPAEDHDSVNDVYRYDDEIGQLACLSCAGDGVLAAGIIGRSTAEANADQEQTGQVASADGSKVVFTTAEQLLESDSNTAADAYLWDEGTLSLASGSTGRAGIAVIPDLGNGPAISADGETVFFPTRATLLPQDLDNGAIDIYAARVDGGFPQEETSVACVGEEACRSALPVTPPQRQSPGSPSFTGGGNVKVKKCAKKRVLRGGRCVKPKAKKQKHKAGNHKAGKGKKKQSRAGSGRRAGR